MVKRKAEGEKVKKTAKKAAKKKDPDAPKRNKSAYMFFCDDKRAEVKKEFPDLKMTEVSKKLAEKWKALSDSEKKVHAFESSQVY
jgi:structure-specific recognition protein 1